MDEHAKRTRGHTDVVEHHSRRRVTADHEAITAHHFGALERTTLHDEQLDDDAHTRSGIEKAVNSSADKFIFEHLVDLVVEVGPLLQQ